MIKTPGTPKTPKITRLLEIIGALKIPGANMEKIIPARDPKQCGGSGRIMYYNVVVDDGDDVGDEYDDDDDVQEDDVEDE